MHCHTHIGTLTHTTGVHGHIHTRMHTRTHTFTHACTQMRGASTHVCTYKQTWRKNIQPVADVDMPQHPQVTVLSKYTHTHTHDACSHDVASQPHIAAKDKQ
eukprot:GDKI01026717.1.p2 GENE.GDKI01026717.1~~GDKI01026717.1.p2  ORF type:complete len:102 (+),score=37.69 GDKI01026717.1:424-729(+)